MSDPIADMLTRIRNGYLAKRKTVEVPYSRMKEKIGQLLVKEKFLASLETVGKKPPEKKLVLKLKYQAKEPVLTAIKRISKPGQRVYFRADKVPPIRLGYGLSIISTSQGLMSDKEAKKKNLGGELICQVW